jgi:hypothetical protein
VFKTKYRIVEHTWGYKPFYEVEFKWWFFPFWLRVDDWNYNETLECAKEYLNNRKNYYTKVVYEEA